MKIWDSTHFDLKSLFQIIVMENYLGSDRVQFTATPVLGLPVENRNAENPLEMKEE